MVPAITGLDCKSLIWSVNSATDCRPEGDADDHQEAGDEKQNSGGTELHVLLEDLPKSEEVQGVPRNEDVRSLNFKDLVDFDY